MRHYLAALVLVLGIAPWSSHGHGRLMNPPARNAMWRYGFTNPINYNDNEVFCGGYGVQYKQNGGKCGVCGDAYNETPPREHEAGGKFGKGVIGKHYVVGQTIEVEVDLTTNHWGYFELKLCPVNHRQQIATQECLDAHPLYLAEDLKQDKFYIPEGIGKSAELKYKVKLPDGVICKQCVVQWTYRTGNTWGECSNGTGAIGCGEQEVFRNCADIQIYSNTAGGAPPVDYVYPQAIYLRDSNSPTGRSPLIVRHQLCKATDLYRSIPEMDSWCQENCLKYPPNCPPTQCKCIDECEGVGRLAGVEGTDVWCQRRCLRYPSNCPEDDCKCFPKKDKEGGHGHGGHGGGDGGVQALDWYGAVGGEEDHRRDHEGEGEGDIGVIEY